MKPAAGAPNFTKSRRWRVPSKFDLLMKRSRKYFDDYECESPSQVNVNPGQPMVLQLPPPPAPPSFSSFNHLGLFGGLSSSPLTVSPHIDAGIHFHPQAVVQGLPPYDRSFSPYQPHSMQNSSNSGVGQVPMLRKLPATPMSRRMPPARSAQGFRRISATPPARQVPYAMPMQVIPRIPTTPPAIRVPNVKPVPVSSEKRGGISIQEFMKRFRQASAFLKALVKCLNEQLSGQEMSQGCMNEALVYLHRFFAVHSMRSFDAQDVAVACLVLANKCACNVSSLKQIVGIWISRKSYRIFGQESYTKGRNGSVGKGVVQQGCKFLLNIETLLLRTLGFQLHVALPHQEILQTAEIGKLKEDALLCATEILSNTDWCLRHSPQELAKLCIFLATNIAGPNLGYIRGCLMGTCYSREIPAFSLLGGGQYHQSGSSLRFFS